MTRRLVLVGAGPAHLHLLRAWRQRPVAGVELTVIAPAEQHYAGMVPGFLRGAYDASALRIDVAALARCAGARHVDAVADQVLAGASTVVVQGEHVPFDVCSIDVDAGLPHDVPSARKHAIPLRPTSRALELRARVDERIATGARFDVVVVGGGLEGVETALAIRARIAAAGARGTVTIAEGGRALLPAEPAAVRARLLRLLRERGIGVVLGGALVHVDEHSVALASGAILPAAIVVWTAHTAPPALLAASDLPLDDWGLLRVDRTLRAASGAPVWGAGDSVAAARDARRQGAVLLRNLRAALGAGRPRRYRPRARALVLLDTADGRAAARWGPLRAYGGWLGWVKRRRDRRTMDRFRDGCDEIPVRAS